MNKLQEKYGTTIRIAGVNSIDSNAKNIKKLPNYIQYNPFKYDILLVSDVVRKQYKVNAFPTLYIVDRKGVIRHVSIGFNPDMGKELSDVIDRLLKE